jgi:hypothetical protein
VTVSVGGVDRLQRALLALDADATDRNVHRAAAEVILDRARTLVPSGPTGKLKRSGRASGTKQAGVVRYGGTAVPWAAPVHFGHPPPRPQGGFIRPDPFMYRAADQRRDEVIEVFARRLDVAIRNQGLG